MSKGIFNLKTVTIGSGEPVIVIGSHKYYPRTFSENLQSKLQLICTDTRAFVPDNNDFDDFVESDFTLNKIVQDIEDLRVSLGVEKVIILGHSIHAFMALEYAYKFPDKVTHLVLVAASPIVGTEIYKEADQYFDESVCPERKAALENTMQKFMKSGGQSFVGRILAFGPRLWYNYNFDAIKLWEGVEINSIGGSIIWGSMFENYDIEKVLKTIKCPIFLALGRYDYFNPPHLWEKYRSFVSDFTIRIFEKSGHTPQLEEASNFDAELIKWLRTTNTNFI